MKKIYTIICSIILAASASAQDCSELFISEYVEGPGNNNAIEIYNPTGSTIDLSEYSINRYGNGASTSPDSWPLVVQSHQVKQLQLVMVRLIQSGLAHTGRFQLTQYF